MVAIGGDGGGGSGGGGGWLERETLNNVGSSYHTCYSSHLAVKVRIPLH